MRIPLSVSGLFIALALSGCDDGSDDGDGAPPVSDAGRADMAAPIVAYDTPPLPDYDAVPMPRLADGRVFITSMAGFTLTVQPDALTPEARAGRCAYTVLACLKSTDGDYDACMPSTPRCADPEYVDPATPACCPAACADAYAQARAAGAAPLDAIDQALFGAAGCIPGAEVN